MVKLWQFRITKNINNNALTSQRRRLMERQNSSTLRGFIHNYRDQFPEGYEEIVKEISTEFETTAYSVMKNDANRMIMFNNLKGYRGYRLLTNVLGSDSRVFFATGTNDLGTFYDNYSRAFVEQSPGKPSIINGPAPFKDTIMKGSSVDLLSLPIPSHFPSDGSKGGKTRYISSGIIAHRPLENPESINLSFTRIQPLSRNTYAFDAGSHGHLWKYLHNAVEENLEAELTVILGTHPVFYLLAASFTDGEYEKATSFINVELASGLENDILVPKDAEIVIEARFRPGETFEEGPFAEYTGYMGHDSTKYTAEVKSILMRADPIYLDIQNSNSSEHVNTFSMPRSARLTRTLRDYMPQGAIFDVNWPHAGARFLSLGFVNPPNKGLAKQLGLGIMALDPLWGKFVIINRGKGTLEFPCAIARLLNTRENLKEMATIVPGVFVISSDFTASNDGTVGKVIVITDSTDEDFSLSTSGRDTVFSTTNGEAVISHSYREDKRLNIIVGRDIDTGNLKQVEWAFATRVNPGTDIEFKEDRMVVHADRPTPEVPRIDENAAARIKELFP